MITELLEQMNNAYQALGRPANMYGWVLEHGRQYNSAALPDDVAKGEVKECFANAINCALEHGYTYAEGSACRPEGARAIPMAVHHAWCVNDADYVIDPTWDDPEGSEYYGVEFDLDWVIGLGYTGLAVETKLREKLKEQAQEGHQT